MMNCLKNKTTTNHLHINNEYKSCSTSVLGVNKQRRPTVNK